MQSSGSASQSIRHRKISQDIQPAVAASPPPAAAHPSRDTWAGEKGGSKRGFESGVGARTENCRAEYSPMGGVLDRLFRAATVHRNGAISSVAVTNFILVRLVVESS